MNVKYQTEDANINAETIMAATYVSVMKDFHWVIMERTASVSLVKYRNYDSIQCDCPLVTFNFTHTGF